MVRLGIVAALLGFLLLGKPLSQGAQLRIGPCAGAGQIPVCPPHPAGVHLRQIEMRLFVAQDSASLRAVVQYDRLDPGLPRPESGDHAKLEHITSAFPARVQRVGGLRAFRTLRGRGPLEVAPGERPPCRPGERVVCGQIAAQHVVHRSGPRGTWGRASSMAGAPKSRDEQDRDAESH